MTVFLLVGRCKDTTDPNESSSGKANPDGATGSDNISLTPDGVHVDNTDTRIGATPEELVGRISEVTIKANDTGDIQPLIDLLGTKNLNPLQTKQLRTLASSSKLKLDSESPFSAIQGSRNRWQLNLFDRSRILLELEETDKGKWQVGKITLPRDGQVVADNNSDGLGDPANPEDAHAAAVAVRGFMDSIINLNPAEARKHIDSSSVSYAKLAGLCIIFEEGQYKLIKDRPLRKMFLRDTTAGWLTRVESPDQGNAAMFAINTKRKDANSPWKITEINLDKLLADYANRFSDGDIHYTPLIKNPKGGDSLVIYFDLNSENLTPRTQRQLKIVANLLKSDQTKKLTISGHTDGLGSDDYNLALSKQRAETVMSFFVKQGVPADQMKIVGFGKSKPRLPNQAEDGTDNPDGRRVNRRAEILLDF
ncbi:MAG: OmpA family protein [Akkermansiaceae bacterium]